MSIDFQIRDFMYPRAIWDLHRTFERNQWLSAEQAEDYPFKRLRLILNRAWEKVPYYRQRFKTRGLHPNDINCLADLASVPTLSKQALRNNRDALIAEDAGEHGLFPCSSSGSTGEPVRFYKGVASALYFLALGFRQLGITDIHFDAVFSTGDLVTEMYRKAVESVFSSTLLDSYGHMERTVAVSQCPQGSYHIHSDYVFLKYRRSMRERSQRPGSAGFSAHLCITWAS